MKSMKNKLVGKLKTLPRTDDDSPMPSEPPSPSTVPSPIPSPVEVPSRSASPDEPNMENSKDDSGECSELLYFSFF